MLSTQCAMAPRIASAKMRPVFNNAFVVEHSWTCSFALAVPQICRNSGYMHGMPISKSLMEIGEKFMASQDSVF
jgi:hypothetical protein